MFQRSAIAASDVSHVRQYLHELRCDRVASAPMLLQLQAAVAEGRAEEAAAAEAELSALGGRASYQAASELTTSRHRTCKWIFSLLTQMQLRPGKGQPPLKLLEVCLR